MYGPEPFVCKAKLTGRVSLGLSSIFQEHHVWRRFLAADKKTDKHVVAAAVDSLVGQKKSSKLPSGESRGPLYITAKTLAQLESLSHELETLAGVPIFFVRPTLIYLESLEYDGLADLPEDEWFEGEKLEYEAKRTVEAKSPNGHNRICVRAQAVQGQWLEDLQSGALGHDDMVDAKSRDSVFQNKYDVKNEWYGKVMCFGPGACGTSILVDQTKGASLPEDAKDLLRAAFQEATAHGPLMGEPLHGVRLNLTDIALHADASQRTLDQLIPALQQATKDALSKGKPQVLEPFYRMQLRNVPSRDMEAVSAAIGRWGGRMEKIDKDNGMFKDVSHFLPARHEKEALEALGDKAQSYIVSTESSHYELMYGGDPTDIYSTLGYMVADVRFLKTFESYD